MDEKYQTDICQSDICQTDICRAEKKYIDSLFRLQDPGSQCEYLLMLGMEKPPLDSLRADRYRIGGGGQDRNMAPGRGPGWNGTFLQ